MRFKIIIRPDEAYYKEVYRELTSVSWIKKWEPVFAVLMIVFGLIMYYSYDFRRAGLSSLIFCLLGIFEIYKIYSNKRKWLKERVNNKTIGKYIEMEFDDNVIKHSGPFSSGELKWTGLSGIIRTKNGIVLKPTTGTNIYLPISAFKEQQEIEFILSKKVTDI